MSSMSRGRATKAPKASKVVKPKQNSKRSTQHNRNYRWKSFNERISTLKIDPIRRKRHVAQEEKAVEATHTFFGEALSGWRDTNLSATFSAFAKDAAPLCDNLPMVLHNEVRIVDLLMEYIEKGDALAMDPLLNLLSTLAQDLDVRFEKHFQRAVATVLAVASKHEDLPVIEASFNSLAWLFKYLQKLLIPNLRPLYDLLAPYIGQAKQKPFVVRYAAQAFSFLVRKAAIVYERDSKPLDTIIEHILRSCVQTANEPSADLHQQGIMALLSEAIQGVQHALVAGGSAILQSTFRYAEVLAKDNLSCVEHIVCGVLTDFIHFSNQEGFKPVIDTILSHISQSVGSATTIRFNSSLLFTVVSVRKGSRVTDWKAISKASKELVGTCEQLPVLESEVAEAVLGLYAVVLQTANTGAVQMMVQTLDNLRKGTWAPYFVQLCDMVLRLGADRFSEMLLAHVQRFVIEKSELDDAGLLMLILRIGKQRPDLRLKCSKAAIKSLSASFDSITQKREDSTDAIAYANLLLAALPYLAIDDSSSEKLRTVFLGLVRLALEGETSLSQDIRSFIIGSVLQQLLKMLPEKSSAADLWVMLCQVSPDFASLPAFWSNTLLFVKHYKPAALDGEHFTILEDAAISALSMASHSIRQDSLDLLQELYRLRKLNEPAILATAITIESIPISLETARSISMNIRRLPPQYTVLAEGDTMQRAIPTYLFGLLHLNLAQAWDDASDAIAAICQSKAGEEVVMNLAQKWMDSESDEEPMPPTSQVIDAETDGFKVASNFECPNLAKLCAIRKQVFGEEYSGLPSPADRLVLDKHRVPLIAPNARTQALKVLSKVPQVAEKRSRLLVPILLRWAGPQIEENEDTSSTDRWARRDQKALLSLFAQFHNPRVLYKADTVFDALLALCANGDVEIQKSALKAVLSWKDKSVTRYEEHLSNLLDENRFREELSVFLHDTADTEDGEEGIRDEDHANLMPVLLRLLYGRSVAGGKEGQAGRRKAIFVALSRFGQETLGQFLDITFKPVAAVGLGAADGDLPQLTASLRQQLGFVNMMNDMLQVLGDSLENFAPKLVRSILACTVSAAHKIEQDTGDMALVRSIRQTGIQCLVKVFSTMTGFDTQSHGSIITQKLILPRLDAFAAETAQSVSGTLRLFSAWSQRNSTSTLFTGPGSTILQHVAELLQGQHTKSEVQIFILQDILDNLVTIDIEESVLQPHVSSFVKAIGTVIKMQPSKDVLDACVHSFSQLAGRIASKSEAADVTKTCTELLKKPNRQVSPSTKSGLLQTILPLIENFPIEAEDNDVKDSLYDAICALYSRLTHAESRVLLSKVLAALVRNDAALLDIAETCEDMNARGARLNEPDFKRRDGAFNKVKRSSESFTVEQWLPLVHNLLYYVRDVEDRVNRTDSSYCLQLFVSAASKHSDEPKWMTLLEYAVLAGIERGMHEKSELVRAEYCQVLNHIIEKFPDWQRINSLRIRGHDDEETSFFLNVLHIQLRRRMAAVQVLEREAANVGSNNASRILLPLLEHFVFDAAEGEAGLNLANQTRKTIGALGKALNKNAFRATFQRYTGYLKNKEKDDYETIEKRVLQLLREMVDGLHSLPVEKRPITDTVIKEQLGPLLEYLHQKDESTVDRRISIAVTIVKLMSGLPTEDFSSRLPGVLTDICHVLRSRSQEARDQTRRALAAILEFIGPNYFSFILKELKGSLKRGYQLHVLSFTVHSLLVGSLETFKPGDLDECLPHLMDVIMDDIFGVTGQEKDAEEYKSGMKEIKSSKSYDTMELLARVTPVRRLGALVRPVRNMLSEMLDNKSIKKIDDLLLRLRKGLDQNPESESRDMLSFCWEIVNQVYAEDNAAHAPKPELDERRKRYEIQPEPEKKKLGPKGSTTSYRFKLIAFALNLLRKVVRRHADLQTTANMAGFLPMAGDALIQGQEEVKLSAVRLLSTIMRVPMKQLEENAPVYVKEAVAMIKGASSSTTDASQAALELVTSVLREKRSVEVKEKDIALLLKCIKMDIDEPDRQDFIYKFLASVLGRKIVITEVYEVMDEVARAMVTNPDRSIKEKARKAYLQFVMDFPQGKDRWEKHTSFLVTNLKYKHAGGRQSVMIFLESMLNKIGAEVLNERAPEIFWTLVPLLVGDPDTKCREMAATLIGVLFERAEDEKLMAQLLNTMETWLKKDKPLLKAGALQCWAVLLQKRDLSQKQLDGLRGKIESILTEQEVEITQPQVVLDALRAFIVLVNRFPAIGLGSVSEGTWHAIQQLPATDDARVQQAIAYLLGAYFTDFASTSSKNPEGLAGLPLRGSGGLELGAEDMRRLCLVSLRALRAVSLSTEEILTAQIVRNLADLGRFFATNEMPWNNNDDESDEEDETTERASETALAHLLRRLSSMLMADKFSIISRTASLSTLEKTIKQLPKVPTSSLQPMLRPLYALTDPTVPKSPGELHKALSDNASELLELLQKKLGTEKFLAALAVTRSEAKLRREERRSKRRIEAVSEPERWQKSKQRKYEGKKIKQKEKGHEARSLRRGW